MPFLDRYTEKQKAKSKFLARYEVPSLEEEELGLERAEALAGAFGLPLKEEKPKPTIADIAKFGIKQAGRDIPKLLPPPIEQIIGMAPLIRSVAEEIVQPTPAPPSKAPSVEEVLNLIPAIESAESLSTAVEIPPTRQWTDIKAGEPFIPPPSPELKAPPPEKETRAKRWLKQVVDLATFQPMWREPGMALGKTMGTIKFTGVGGRPVYLPKPTKETWKMLGQILAGIPVGFAQQDLMLLDLKSALSNPVTFSKQKVRTPEGEKSAPEAMKYVIDNLPYEVAGGLMQLGIGYGLSKGIGKLRAVGEAVKRRKKLMGLPFPGIREKVVPTTEVLPEGVSIGLERVLGIEKPKKKIFGKAEMELARRLKAKGVTEKPTVARAKEPWEMTQKTYNESISLKEFASEMEPVSRLRLLKEENPKLFKREILDREHKTIVKEALSEGKPVPKEVLVEYPELKAKPSPFKEGMQVYIQLPKHRKPHRATIQNIFYAEGKPSKIHVRYSGTKKGVMFDATLPVAQIEIPSKVIRLREYHEALGKVPKERRAGIKAKAREFDRTLQDNADIWYTMEEMEARFVGADRPKQIAIREHGLLSDLREKVSQEIGVKDLQNPVERAGALEKLQRHIETLRAKEVKGGRIEVVGGDLKPGDRVKIQEEWYRVEPTEEPGAIKLTDGRTIEIDVFDKLEVQDIKKAEGIPGQKGAVVQKGIFGEEVVVAKPPVAKQPSLTGLERAEAEAITSKKMREVIGTKEIKEEILRRKEAEVLPGQEELKPTIPPELEGHRVYIRTRKGVPVEPAEKYGADVLLPTGKYQQIGKFPTRREAYQTIRDWRVAQKGKAKELRLEKKRREAETFAGRAELPGPTEPSTPRDILKKSEIIKSLREKLEVPVRTGRFKERAKGIYKRREKIIRLKSASDLPTLSHEIGHHIEEIIFPKAPRRLEQIRKYQKEIIALTREAGFPKRLQTRAEGFAEFVRLYITDPKQAQAKTPKFHAYFEGKMTEFPELHDILLGVRRDVQRWVNQPATAKVLSQVSVAAKEPSDVSINRIYTMVVDDLRPIQVAVKEMSGGKLPRDIANDPFRQAWLLRGWTGKANAFLNYGIMDKAGNKTFPSFKEILKPVAGDLDAFRTYGVAKRALERHRRGFETGIDPRDASASLAELSKKSPIYEKTFNQLVEFQDKILDYLSESGVVGTEELVKLRAYSKDYLPFYRVFEETKVKGFRTGRGMANLADPVKRFKGSGREIVDPLESIIKNVYAMVSIAERNKVASTLVDLAARTKGAGKWVEALPTPEHGWEFKLGEIQRFLADAGAEGVDADVIARIFRPSIFAPAKENILTVFRDGKPRFYQVQPDLYRALLALDQESSGILIRILSKPARMLRAGAVLTPEFALYRNPFRDQMTAFVYSKYGYRPGIDLARGLFHAVKRDDLYWKWQSSGGAHATLVSLDRNYLRGALQRLLRQKVGQIAKDVIVHPIETLRAISEFTEEATRIGEFKRGLEKGATLREAALASRDVTLDFSRVGAKGRIPNQLIAFFNAQVQGVDKMVRSFKENPTRTTVRAVQGITIPSLILYAFNRNNPQYRELPAWRRDWFWNIPVGNRFISIPKPFELGIIFGSFPERLFEWVDTQDPDAFDELAGNLWEGLTPNVLPTALQPIIEVVANRSFFTGRPIVSEGRKRLIPSEQYSPYTPETFKAVGKRLGVSSAKLEHIWRGYTAGLGRLPIAGMEELFFNPPERPRDIAYTPMLRGIITPEPTGFRSRSVQKFYDFKEKVNRLSATWKVLSGDEARKFREKHPEIKWNTSINKRGKVLSTLRKQRQRIMDNPNITAEEKKRQIKPIDTKVIKIVQNFLVRIKGESGQSKEEKAPPLGTAPPGGGSVGMSLLPMFQTAGNWLRKKLSNAKSPEERERGYNRITEMILPPRIKEVIRKERGAEIAKAFAELEYNEAAIVDYVRSLSKETQLEADTLCHYFGIQATTDKELRDYYRQATAYKVKGLEILDYKETDPKIIEKTIQQFQKGRATHVWDLDRKKSMAYASAYWNQAWIDIYDNWIAELEKRLIEARQKGIGRALGVTR